jgi:Bacterial PH domain
MHPASECSGQVARLAPKLHYAFEAWTTKACDTTWLCAQVSCAKEFNVVPTENRSEALNVRTDPFMTNNLIVAPGAPGTVPAVSSNQEESSALADSSVGIEDEQTLWEGRYSAKNFLGRAILGTFCVLAWLALALATWGFGYSALTFLTYVVGGLVLLYCCFTGFKFLCARRNYFYRLTSRRLFLTTGFFDRRVDQVELIRIKDLFMRQTLVGSWLDVGTVTLVSSEKTLPKAVLLGIEEPQRVRDLIWHHTRLERDRRTTEVERV